MEAENEEARENQLIKMNMHLDFIEEGILAKYEIINKVIFTNLCDFI